MREVTIDEVLGQFARWIRTEVVDGATSSLTAQAYLNDVRDHAAWLTARQVDLAALTDEICIQYRTYLLEHFKPNTVSRKLSSLRKFYGATHSRGLLPRNFATRLKNPPKLATGDMRGQCLGTLQLQRILALPITNHTCSVNAQVKATRDKAILELTIRHGLREIEIVRANEADLRLKSNGEISELCVIGVRSRPQTIYLAPQSESALDRWLATRALMHVADDESGSPLFVSLHWADNGHGRGGYRLSTRGVRAMLDRYLTAAGAKLPGISGNVLRHSPICPALDPSV